jgi:hypothetical protein
LESGRESPTGFDAESTSEANDAGSVSSQDSSPQASSSSSSTNSGLLSPFSIDAANQKRYIAQDLIDLLLGTIDSLIRGITPPNGEDIEMEDGATIEPGPSSECSTEKAPSNGSANDDGEGHSGANSSAGSTNSGEPNTSQ